MHTSSQTSAVSIHEEPDNSKSASWSTCTTARESPYILQRFIDHHISLGASQIHIFLDRPSPDMLEWSKLQTVGTVIICDAHYYDSLNTAPDTFVQFQMYNFRRFLKAYCTTDWAIHIDCDEFVSSERNIALLLGQLGNSADALQLLPAEPVFGPAAKGDAMSSFDQAYARLALRTATPRTLAHLYGDLGCLLKHGLAGHSAGKTFVRLGGSISRFRLHNTRAESPSRNITANESLVRLLHYDAVDIAHFIRKMNTRIAKKEKDMGNGKELLLERYRDTTRHAEDKALLRLFRGLYSLDAEQLAALKANSSVVSLDPSTLQFREAPDPSGRAKELQFITSAKLLKWPKRQRANSNDNHKQSLSPPIRFPIMTANHVVKKARRWFVILTQPRSGSYLLVDLLNQVPGIRCHPEIFKPGRLELHRDIKPHVKWTVSGRDERPILYMRAVLSIGDYKATGFKLFPEHNKRLLSHISSAKHIHKIVLLRHPLSRFVSRLRAEATGRWVDRKADSRAKETEVICTFESSRFNHFLQHHEKFVGDNAKAAAASPASYTLVDYEEVVSLHALAGICRALGVDPADTSLITPTLEKQTKEPLPALIGNYDEMKAYLIDKHPRLLEQPGCPRLD